MADPVPGTTPRQTGSATGLATKLATAPLSPFLKVVNSLMQKYPGEYSAHPPEGKDRVDRFFGMNTSLIDQPGGTKIQTPLIHPQTGFIHTGLGLQPTGGSTAGGALIAPGLKPGPGISRDQFITSLKQSQPPIRLSPSVRAFLDAIERSSFGMPTQLGRTTPQVDPVARRLGTPINQAGRNIIGSDTAMPPLVKSPMFPEVFARWLRATEGARRTAAGLSSGTSYPIESDELKGIMGEFTQEQLKTLVKVLRAGTLKPGTENN